MRKEENHFNKRNSIDNYSKNKSKSIKIYSLEFLFIFDPDELKLIFNSIPFYLRVQFENKFY